MKQQRRRLARAKTDIDDTLKRQAMRIGGAETKREVRNQRSIRRLRGGVVWEGNLEESPLGARTRRNLRSA